MRGGNSDWVAQPQVIKLIKIKRRRADGIAFVHAEHHRFAAFLQHGGNLRIRRHNAGAQICDQHDHIRALNRQLRLPAHLGENHIICARFNAARVDEQQVVTKPLTVAINPVTCYARRIVNNGEPLAHQLIK